MRQADWGWLAAIVAVGALLRLWGLGSNTLWGDEALSLILAQYSIAELFFAPVDPTPGLYYVVQKAWLVLGGDPLIVRLPAFLFGVAAIPATFVLARTLAGTSAGLWAAALCALFSEWVHYSQEARAYSLLLLLIILALAALAHALRDPARPEGRWLVGAGVFAILALYTHVASWFFVGPLALWTLWRVRQLFSPRALLLWTALGFAAVLPEINRALDISQAQLFTWLERFSIEHFFGTLVRMAGPWPSLPDPRVTDWLLSQPASFKLAALAAHLVTLAALAGLAILYILRSDIRPGGTARAMLVTLLLVGPVGLYLIGYITPMLLPRTLLPFQLGVALAVGYAVARTGWRWLGALFTLMVAAELILFTPPQPKQRWDAIATIVESVAPQAVVICPHWNAAAFLHEHRAAREGQMARDTISLVGNRPVRISDANLPADALPRAFLARLWHPSTQNKLPAGALRPDGSLVVVSRCEGEQAEALEAWLGDVQLVREQTIGEFRVIETRVR